MILTNSQTDGAIISQIRFTPKKTIYTIEALLKILKVSPESGEDTLISEFGKFCVKENGSA